MRSNLPAFPPGDGLNPPPNPPPNPSSGTSDSELLLLLLLFPPPKTSNPPNRFASIMPKYKKYPSLVFVILFYALLPSTITPVIVPISLLVRLNIFEIVVFCD